VHAAIARSEPAREPPERLHAEEGEDRPPRDEDVEASTERSEQETVDEGGKRTVGIADIAIEHFAFGEAQRRVHLAPRVLERQNPTLERRDEENRENEVRQEPPEETRPVGRSRALRHQLS
jgi:hypothetical protein